ncbi:MAG: helix-turn-helix domain-containing protein [Candidatus Limnocylindrales bacterium]
MANTDRELPTDSSMTLGDRIRVARARRRQTLRDLAIAVGKAPSYLSDIENDRRVPSEDLLAILAAELDLDFDELMAAAGRIGSDADRYLRRTPAAGVLFRRLSKHNVGPEALERLIAQVSDLAKDDAADHHQ